MIKVGIVIDEFGNLNRGGAEIQVEKTVEYLNKLPNITAEYITYKTRNIDEYDIVHFFKSMYHFKDLALWLDEKKIPYVVSTIYYPNKSVSFEKLIYKLFKVIPNSTINMFSLAKRINLWKNAKYLFPNTDDEKYFFESLKINKNIEIIPNGLDRNEMLEVSEDDFYSKYPELRNKKFILNIARIEKRKNQEKLFEVCMKNNIPLVIIGKVWDEKILERMREKKYKNFYYLGPIYDKKILFSAYKACDIFALPSLVETPGIAALEAAYYGAKIVITKFGGTKYYFKDSVHYVDPNNINDIEEKILLAYKQEKKYNYEKIIENYYWDTIVKKYEVKYNEILENRK